MEKINIDRKITKRADEFAEREYECGVDERAHLSKGYYWGYKDAQKDLALTPSDMSIIDEICTEMRLHTDWPLKGQDAFYEEVLRRFLKRKGEA